MTIKDPIAHVMNHVYGQGLPLSQVSRIHEAVREALNAVREEVQLDLSADLEDARANARHYVNLALEIQNQKDHA